MGIDNLNRKLSNINKDDTYSMLLMLLYASSDNPRYSTLNELCYVLDHDNFLNFIKYYEGQTITVPNMHELEESLRVLALFQYYKVEALDWRDSLEKSGFLVSESSGARLKLNKFLSQLDKNNYKLGGLVNGSKRI